MSTMQVKIVDGQMEITEKVDQIDYQAHEIIFEERIDMCAWPGVLLRKVQNVEITDKELGKRTMFIYYENFSEISLTRIPPLKQVITSSPLDLQEAVVVAGKVQQAQDKFPLLEWVVDKTGLVAALKAKAAELKKKPGELRIVIKPNFMWSYNVIDHSTYTDPELVEKLIDFIHAEGFINVTIVEAQSTYGVFYKNREVRSVARYLGYNLDKYPVVDLTLDEQLTPETPFRGSLKGTKVPKTWAEADFRIIFAKNKTHAFAYYTLNLKCVYGALPEMYKFKEFHHDRGIAGSTMEYLRHYPVHFGFIDAVLSADGENGVYACKNPVKTNTIIGGANVIANDWIGASKMGLNPMFSIFMKQAVPLFGKPRIHYISRELSFSPSGKVPLESAVVNERYTPWTNVNTMELKFMLGYVNKHLLQGVASLYAFYCECDQKVFPLRPVSQIEPFKNLPLVARLIIRKLRLIGLPYRLLIFKTDNPAEKLLERAAGYLDKTLIKSLLTKLQKYL